MVAKSSRASQAPRGLIFALKKGTMKRVGDVSKCERMKCGQNGVSKIGGRVGVNNMARVRKQSALAGSAKFDAALATGRNR